MSARKKENEVVVLLEEIEDEETGETRYEPYQTRKMRETGRLPCFQPWIDIPAGLVRESDLA